MVGNDLRERIKNFIQQVNEPYVLTESKAVLLHWRERILEEYVPRIIVFPDGQKGQILDIIEESRSDNSDHGKIRHWGRAMIGIANFLLIPTNMNEVLPHEDQTTDVVLRVSRWFHTNRDCNIWKRFLPYVDKIVQQGWGTIPNFYGNEH